MSLLLRRYTVRFFLNRYWILTSAIVCPQERGLHRGGNADPEAPVGRVRSHGGHFQDRHAAHQAHAARGRVRLLQGLPAAGVCGGEVAADGRRPAVPPLCAGQLLKSEKSPSPSLPRPPAPPPGSPAFTNLHRRHRQCPGLPAIHAVYNQCLPCQEGCQVVPVGPARGKTKTAVPEQEQETWPKFERAPPLESSGSKHSFTVAEVASQSGWMLRNHDCDRRSGDVSCRRKLGCFNIFIWQTITHRNVTL